MVKYLKSIGLAASLIFLFGCANLSQEQLPGSSYMVLKSNNDFQTMSSITTTPNGDYKTTLEEGFKLIERNIRENFTIRFIASNELLNECGAENIEPKLNSLLNGNPRIGGYLINNIELSVTLLANKNIEIYEDIKRSPDGAYIASFYVPLENCSNKSALEVFLQNRLYDLVHEIYHVDDMIDVEYGARLDVVKMEYTAMKRSNCDLIMQPRFEYLNIEHSANLTMNSVPRRHRGYVKFYRELENIANSLIIEGSMSEIDNIKKWCEKDELDN